MNNNFCYNGVVTLIERVNNKIVSRKFFNNGTNLLFEAYNRAISGQPISKFVPQYIKVFGDTYTEITKVPIPVLVTYKDANTDGANYGVPYTRVSVVITSSMLDLTKMSDTESHDIRLYCSNAFDETDMLAKVNVEGLGDATSNMTPAVQLILLWDLYVTNGGNK